MSQRGTKRAASPDFDDSASVASSSTASPRKGRKQLSTAERDARKAARMERNRRA